MGRGSGGSSPWSSGTGTTCGRRRLLPRPPPRSDPDRRILATKVFPLATFIQPSRESPITTAFKRRLRGPPFVNPFPLRAVLSGYPCAEPARSAAGRELSRPDTRFEDSLLMSATVAHPNFFLVGAPRAGTTSLWHYLRDHPEIHMPSGLAGKEPSFFCDLTP